jgi:hypothetical protein
MNSKINLEYLLSLTKSVGDCLEWTRGFNHDGYPRIRVGSNSNGKVHRIVYSLHTGEDISGLVVRHKCDNPKCINPYHLEVGTYLDNIKDMLSRKRNHRHISSEEAKAIFELRNLGHTHKTIGNMVGRSRQSVEYILNRRETL